MVSRCSEQEPESSAGDSSPQQEQESSAGGRHTQCQTMWGAAKFVLLLLGCAVGQDTTITATATATATSLTSSDCLSYIYVAWVFFIYSVGLGLESGQYPQVSVQDCRYTGSNVPGTLPGLLLYPHTVWGLLLQVLLHHNPPIHNPSYFYAPSTPSPPPNPVFSLNRTKAYGETKKTTTTTTSLHRTILFSCFLHQYDVSVCVSCLVECVLRKPFI